MTDNLDSRVERLRPSSPRRRAPNTGALVAVALAGGVALGIAGLTYYQEQAGDAPTGPALETSNPREFQRNTDSGMRPVITPSPEFSPQERGPSEAELALRNRVDELERLLNDARSQPTPEPALYVDEMDELQRQLDGLRGDMQRREEEMSDLSAQRDSLTAERDQLQRDLRRQGAQLDNLQMRLDTAGQNESEEQRLAAEQEERRLELERRRAEAQAVLEAQINSPLDALSGSGGSRDERQYTGDEAFIRAGAVAIEPTRSRVIGAPSNTVLAGTVIEATLTTGINSELSGTITSTVSHDIWSFDMRRVLIPRGSQMFGRYSNGVALGQRRVLVAWDRLVTPDGQVVDLDAYGSDRLGRSGLTGRVDTRFAQRFGAAFLISVFAAVPAAAASSTDDEGTDIVLQDVGEDTSDAVSSVVDEYLSLAPIITVEHGSVITIMATNDLELF